MQRTVAFIGMLVIVAAACGTPARGDARGTAPIPPSLATSEDECGDMASLAAALRPAIAYDYEPSPSPKALADRVAVVIAAEPVTGLAKDGDWLNFTLAGVEVLQDNREAGSNPPTAVSLEVGSGYGNPPGLDRLSGVQVIAFTHEWDAAPTGLTVDVEGMWLACDPEDQAAPVVENAIGAEWPAMATLMAIREAIGESPDVDSSADPSGQAPEAPPLIAASEADGSLPPTLEIGCRHGPAFPASALGSIEPLSPSDPVAAAVKPFLESEEGAYWPQHGWLVLHRTDERVLLVTAGDAVEQSISFMSVEWTGEEWQWSGAQSGAECALQTTIPAGFNQVDWRLDPDAPSPGPEATEVVLLATERECASGQAMGERLLDPDVVMTDTEVLIAMAATPPPGDAQSCPSNPEQRVIVSLPEPLGSRTLVDGLSLDIDLAPFLP